MKFNKKVILTSIFLVIASFHLPVNAKNEQKKVITPVEQCQKLFKETENLIAEAEKQPGTHTQLKHIKNKLNQSKQQILEMDLAVQINTCDKGLAKLGNINPDYRN